MAERILIAGGDSNDLAAYDRMARTAKKRGFSVMSMGFLAETTLDQETVDLDDRWLRFSANCPALMKIAETSLVNVILAKEHIEKNVALASEKSAILAKHGLGGTLWILEPMWLPESFYEKHPEMRGARCDNPCLALADYYSPCLDNDEILAHYREMVRRFVEIAPQLSILNIGTNDSGAGICWCSGLYPGPNGPAHCKDVPMGVRMRRWFEAMIAGAEEAGRSLQIVFNPVHFSRFETKDTIEHLPERAAVSPGGNFPDTIALSKKLNRAAVSGISPSLVEWCLWPAMETTFPYYALEQTRALADSGADIVSVGGLAAPVRGVDTVTTMAVLSGLESAPASTADIEKRVLAIARRHAGPRLAPVLVTAWRDVDYALRIWFATFNADTNHLLMPQYSVVGDRWLIRPIMPDPSKISAAEKEYYNRHRHGRLSVEPDSFIIAEGTRNYRTDELKWPVEIYNCIVGYMDRAVKTLEEAMPAADAEKAPWRERFLIQYRRVAVLRSVWRNQRNVLRAASIIEFFTCDRQDEYWHVIRKDESFHTPATYRRFFLEAMDDEISNSRDMIRLMGESGVKLYNTGPEDTFILPDNLPELLDRKIALMEAHKGDIDVLFPDCPPETYSDPTYEWADKMPKQRRD